MLNRSSIIENHLSRKELEQRGITPDSIKRLLETTCRAWIADVDDKPVGFSMANCELATIFALFVLPNFEGRGIGKALLHIAEAWLWEQGIEEIWLDTGTNHNIRANGFYKYVGWIFKEVTGEKLNRYIKQRPN